jgi:ABC-type molybdate transport system substrate-binding protein
MVSRLWNAGPVDIGVVSVRQVASGVYAQEAFKVTRTEALGSEDPVVARQSVRQIWTVFLKGDIGIEAISDGSHLADHAEGIGQNDWSLEHQEKVRLIALDIPQQGTIEFANGGVAQSAPDNPHGKR